jgi:glycine cleavage system H protein
MMSDVPADRRYSKTHEWFQPSGDEITIGITQFAADELTDITFVSLPKPGATLAAGKAFGEIESVKATSELFTAVGGEVIAANGKLNDAPELVNSDPYHEGWMIKLRAADTLPLNELMDAKAYMGMISQ